MKKKLDRPQAYVKKPTGTRKGRGFSIPEIKLAHITIQKLYSKKLAYDKRRKTSYKKNIDFLKELFSHTTQNNKQI